MAVPKKRTSVSKKRIRRNIWLKNGYLTALKAQSLAKSVFWGNSKRLIQEQSNNKIFGFGLFVQQTSQIDIDSNDIDSNDIDSNTFDLIRISFVKTDLH